LYFRKRRPNNCTGGAKVTQADAMKPIIVPKVNNNDDSCVLLEWRVADGERVEAGAAIAVLETSKATVDLLAEHAGVVLRTAAVQESHAFGASLGWIFDDAEALARHRAGAELASSSGSAPLTLTDAAKELVAARGITEAQLRALGKTVIKRDDIEALLQPAATAAHVPAGGDRRQAAIARVVSQSHATIPRAFLLVRVDCERALATVAAVREREDVFIGLPELLVRAVAALAERFPRLYTVAGVAPTDPDVGVTFDFGRGLYVPVVRAARSRSIRELAVALAELKMKAVRDQFTAEDLRGGHISISLNTAPDVVLSLPIILPEQVCMVSLGGLVSEFAPDGDGRPVLRRVAHVGIAYDHRFVNGFEAMQFASAIKRGLEAAGP
jgi:2-oxoglutarate dehydrogenase E2 component (dihydrolipoamide succinyltransferase)